MLDSRILWVALGGAGGSVARYLIAGLVQRGSNLLFPIGTMTVNVVGCLLIGFLSVRLESSLVPAHYRVALLVGFLGGFTTFSSFSLETMTLIERRESFAALLNVVGSVVIGLLACWIGQRIARGMGS